MSGRSSDVGEVFEAIFGDENGLDDHERLPGLHRPWELEQVIQPGRSYVVQDGGKTADGTPLFTIYRERCRRRPEK